jgi:hypothetical protein
MPISTVDKFVETRGNCRPIGNARLFLPSYQSGVTLLLTMSELVWILRLGDKGVPGSLRWKFCILKHPLASQQSEIEKLSYRSSSYLLVLFAVALIFLSRGSALAQDFMAGTVVSAEIEKLEIELIPITGDPARPDGKEKKSVTVKLSADNLVISRMGRRVFPGCVYPGGRIRLWGHMDQGVFMATEIRGWGGKGRSDPTGVRRRLQRRGGWNCPGGPGFHGGRQ